MAKEHDLLQGKANEAYDSAAGAANEATREPTAYEQAKGYMSPPSTADNIRGGAEDTAAAASARFQSVKDRIAAVGQPQQKSYFQQAKVTRVCLVCGCGMDAPWCLSLCLSH